MLRRKPQCLTAGILQERQFLVSTLHTLASVGNLSTSVCFYVKSILVKNVEKFDCSQAKLVFFIASSKASARYVQEAANIGCLVIDTSGLFALEPDLLARGTGRQFAGADRIS